MMKTVFFGYGCVLSTVISTVTPQGGCKVLRSACLYMSVCLCFCPLAYLENYTSKFHEIICAFLVAVDRSSSDDNAVRYVLLVLWMKSCFHTIVSDTGLVAAVIDESPITPN